MIKRFSRAIDDLRGYIALCERAPEKYDVRQTYDGVETSLAESCRIVLDAHPSLTDEDRIEEQIAAELSELEASAFAILQERAEECCSTNDDEATP